MSLRPRFDVALWLVAAIGVVFAVVGWRTTPVAAASIPAIGAAPTWSPISQDSLEHATSRLVDTDPFRLDRRPALLAYEETPEGGPPMVAHPPRPALVLKGIIGSGHPVSWEALLDGVPGHAQTMIVRSGDTLGGLHVRHVGRDTLVVTASDTTWRLTVRQAWQ